jgi:hypothetical protein
MMSTFKTVVLCGVLVAGCAAENPQLLCSIEKPLAEVNETVRLEAWLVSLPKETLIKLSAFHSRSS